MILDQGNPTAGHDRSWAWNAGLHIVCQLAVSIHEARYAHTPMVISQGDRNQHCAARLHERPFVHISIAYAIAMPSAPANLIPHTNEAGPDLQHDHRSEEAFPELIPSSYVHGFLLVLRNYKVYKLLVPAPEQCIFLPQLPKLNIRFRERRACSLVLRGQSGHIVVHGVHFVRKSLEDFAVSGTSRPSSTCTESSRRSASLLFPDKSGRTAGSICPSSMPGSIRDTR